MCCIAITKIIRFQNCLCQVYHFPIVDKCVSHFFQRVIFVPNPTWGNHPFIFTLAGLSVEYFRYYDPQTRGLDFEG